MMKQIKIKRDEPISPIVFLRAPKAQIKTLDLVKADMMNYIELHGESISRLTLAVNDSASGKLFDDVYEQEELLGEGGFAFVYRCTHKIRHNTYAVKQIDAENYDCGGSNIKEELNALKKLRDVPYIVKLLDVFVEPDRTCLIMEEMVGGDLLDRIYEKEIYSESDARKLSRRLLEAIYFCHRKKIVHRDIKPENILLVNKEDDTNIKLGDFGCAKYMDTNNPYWEGLTTLCGSPQYVAPELYTHTDGYNHMCDLWSVGIVLYVILGGYAPFEAPTRDLPGLICEGYVVFHQDYWSGISSEPKELISHLLKVDISKRWNTKQALDCEWLRRRDKDHVVVTTTTTTTATDSLDNNNNSLSTFEAWIQRQNESSSHVSFDSYSYRGGGTGGGINGDNDDDNEDEGDVNNNNNKTVGEVVVIDRGQNNESEENNKMESDDDEEEESKSDEEEEEERESENQQQQQQEKVPTTIDALPPTTTKTKDMVVQYTIPIDNDDSDNDDSDTNSDDSSGTEKTDEENNVDENDNHDDDDDDSVAPSSPPPIVVAVAIAVDDTTTDNKNSRRLSNTIGNKEDSGGGDDNNSSSQPSNPADASADDNEDDDDDDKDASQLSLTVDDL